MKKQEVIDILAEMSITEISIECSNEDCYNSDSEDLDEELGTYFYRKGWRVDEHRLPICPDCVNKLKIKQ